MDCRDPFKWDSGGGQRRRVTDSCSRRSFAVVEESAVPTDEAVAAMAIERALPGFTLFPWLHKLNSGALQCLFDIHVPLVHQALGLGREVSQWPDHCFLWGVAYWPPGQGDVVPVPSPWDLQYNIASRAQLVADFVQADVLMVGAEMCAGINVVLWPWNVGFAMAAGLLQGEQFGLVEVGGVTAAQGPEHEAVTDMAAAVL